jgi:hypothetical protein
VTINGKTTQVTLAPSTAITEPAIIDGVTTSIVIEPSHFAKETVITTGG